MIKKPILLDVPMPIFTQRLQIRPRQIGEGKILADAINESREHLKVFMPFAVEPATVDGMEEHCRKNLAEFIMRTNFTLSIYDRAGQELIGSTGLHRMNWEIPSFEIGYWVRKKFEGQGYITETANALTRYAFAVFGAKRVEIKCDAENTRSLAVMLKLGFQQEAVLKNQSVGPGGIRDTIITARTNLDSLPPLDVSWK